MAAMAASATATIDGMVEAALFWKRDGKSSADSSTSAAADDGQVTWS